MSERPKLDAATLQIKEIHASGGKQLTKQQLADYAQRQSMRYMGAPTAWRVQARIEVMAAIKAGTAKHQAGTRRGRKPRTVFTQYDASYLRWRGLHHRLIRLPALRKRTGYLDHALLERLLLTYHQQGTPRHKLVARVLKHLREQLPNLPCPDPRTLRRLLAAALQN